ncbi:MAG: Peptide chain release factor RF2 [Myxococcota bacterium]|nr:Peptide chain release factor RF2 [Myxococcota bacterium]
MISGGFFDIPGIEKRLKEIEEIGSAPDFWNNQERAKSIQREKSALDAILEPYHKYRRVMEDALALYDLGIEAGDESVEGELMALLAEIGKGIHDLEFKRMLSGQEDPNNAIVSVNAGAGGTESCDWASMLLRMYLRYCELKGWKTELNEETPGETAGIKSSTFTVTGPYAYGHLKAEMGVHRLVRISPFDANKRRHTSFASVYVMPEISDDVEIDIAEKDLRVDTYRSSGAGGQHVNKTDSAIRITHIPTGVVVACQNERSQHQNRHTAMKMLRSRLYALELQKREEKIQNMAGEKKDIAWGSQIRSYVLQPYQMVKDLRTGVTTGNPQAVLDGELDQFIEAYLMKKGSGQSMAVEDLE